jgi:hypothetical protein
MARRVTDPRAYASQLAAGLFYPSLHVRLPPAVAGLMMSLSSVTVVCSSLLLKNYSRPTLMAHDWGLLPGAGSASPAAKPARPRWARRAGYGKVGSSDTSAQELVNMP